MSVKVYVRFPVVDLLKKSSNSPCLLLSIIELIPQESVESSQWHRDKPLTGLANTVWQKWWFSRTRFECNYFMAFLLLLDSYLHCRKERVEQIQDLSVSAEETPETGTSLGKIRKTLLLTCRDMSEGRPETRGSRPVSWGANLQVLPALATDFWDCTVR